MMKWGLIKFWGYFGSKNLRFDEEKVLVEVIKFYSFKNITLVTKRKVMRLKQAFIM